MTVLTVFCFCFMTLISDLSLSARHASLEQARAALVLCRLYFRYDLVTTTAEQTTF